MAEAVGRLRYLIVGGDVIAPRIVHEALRHYPPQRLINGYGPTETTTFAITNEIREVPEGSKSIPLGRPISNTQIYILDAYGAVTPIEATGELYIGGAGVARGYLNRPELTAERFLPDPFSAEPGARLYKTGDLGRWLTDGRIEFLGRNDFQVKIRGFRVELGEIESKLAGFPGVREVVVAARDDGEAGKRLVAYYTGQEVGAEKLRKWLSSSLPEYMVPAAYAHLESLPLTANGKLDRRGLPAPDGEAYVRRGYEPPVGEIEAQLAHILTDLLHLERVGKYDNFFELGGDSLSAMRFVVRCRQIRIAISVTDVFTYPTIESLVASVQERCTGNQ